MKFKQFLNSLTASKPALAVLVDPDKFNPELIKLANANNVSCFFVGGSKLKTNNVKRIITQIKGLSAIPVILFPGDEKQLVGNADGLLLLSLISGRNPEYLIEKHVKAAPIIKRLKLQHLPTAYILVDGGKKSTTQKVTKTIPLKPADKNKIIFTSLAGEQLGFKAIYLEAGSGAKNNIPLTIIKQIRKTVSVPLIVGGGVDSAKKARDIINAGANLVVVGNALEKKYKLIKEIGQEFK